MERNLFNLCNEEGVLLVASSRSGATEVYRLNDGSLIEVQHLASGRDTLAEVPAVPSYLTVRYNPPRPVVGLVREFVEK